MKTLRRLLISSTVLAILAVLTASGFAQGLRLPRPSQKASVMQTVGVTDITITYSRPGVKGRKIWGDPPAGAVGGTATLDDARTRIKDAPIVPFGHVWRTGANEATVFEVNDNVLINGQPLAAGKYSLHTLPGKDEWVIIFNSDAGQWGSFSYDEKKDVLRVKTKPEMVADSQEWLMYSFDPVTDDTAQINIRWEKLKVPFTVSVKDVKGLAMERARAAVAAAKPDDATVRNQAANYAFQNKINTEEAMQWVDQSIKIRETFGNMSLKARLLAAQKKNAEAIAAGEKALELGKVAKTNARTLADFQKEVDEWKSRM